MTLGILLPVSAYNLLWYIFKVEIHEEKSSTHRYVVGKESLAALWKELWDSQESLGHTLGTTVPVKSFGRTYTNGEVISVLIFLFHVHILSSVKMGYLHKL